jgi:hypothetical protein
VLPGNNDRRVLIVIEAAKAATHSSLARPAMARGGTAGAGAGGEGRAASEALTADSADEEGRRGSSSSASSDAASSFSCTYSPAPPDEWHKVAIIKTCVSVSADAAGGGGGKDQKPRGVVAAADRHGGASGTYTSANNPPIGLVSAGRAVSHTVVVRARA